MSVTIQLWHVVAVSTGLCWIAAIRVPAGHQLNPFNSIVAGVLFLVPIVFWGAFFIGRFS